jgi:hypothetical protein
MVTHFVTCIFRRHCWTLHWHESHKHDRSCLLDTKICYCSGQKNQIGTELIYIATNVL